MFSQRPYSIRTRIKTRGFLRHPTAFPVRDHIPLEQGLRHFPWAKPCLSSIVRDHIPLEQGLRPAVRLFFRWLETVRDHIPLEQGLRLLGSFWLSTFFHCQRPYSIRTRIKTLTASAAIQTVRVRDHIPLEQGLRHKEQSQLQMIFQVRDHIPLEQGLRQQRWN